MDKIKEPVSEEGSSFDKLKAHLLRGKNLQKFVENVIKKTFNRDIIPLILSLIEINIISSVCKHLIKVLFIW